MPPNQEESQTQAVSDMILPEFPSSPPTLPTGRVRATARNQDGRDRSASPPGELLVQSRTGIYGYRDGTDSPQTYAPPPGQIYRVRYTLDSSRTVGWPTQTAYRSEIPESPADSPQAPHTTGKLDMISGTAPYTSQASIPPSLAPKVESSFLTLSVLKQLGGSGTNLGWDMSSQNLSPSIWSNHLHGLRYESGKLIPTFSACIKTHWIYILCENTSGMDSIHFKHPLLDRFTTNYDSYGGSNKLLVIAIAIKPKFEKDIREDYILKDIIVVMKELESYKESVESYTDDEIPPQFDTHFENWLDTYPGILPHPKSSVAVGQLPSRPSPVLPAPQNPDSPTGNRQVVHGFTPSPPSGNDSLVFTSSARHISQLMSHRVKRKSIGTLIVNYSGNKNHNPKSRDLPLSGIHKPIPLNSGSHVNPSTDGTSRIQKVLKRPTLLGNEVTPVPMGFPPTFTSNYLQNRWSMKHSTSDLVEVMAKEMGICPTGYEG